MIATTATVKHNGVATGNGQGNRQWAIGNGEQASADRTIAHSPFTIASADSSVLRIIVHPYEGPRGGVDVTDTVVGAIAERLWNMFGGNDVLNWLEAERLLQDALVNIRRRDVL